MLSLYRSTTRRSLSSATSPICRSPSTTTQATQTRQVSSSPYGRTHIWKRRAPVLPNPVVAKFPQQVIRSDGTSFVHWTTSPKSLVRLTRDTTNNPMYDPATASDRSVEEESGTTGRLGRFNRRFEGLGADIEEIGWSVEGDKKPVEKKAEKVKAAGRS